MREIVFDTETTGFHYDGADRLVEIGCVEMVNRVETGRIFHAYYHPERAMSAEAQQVHGLSDAFLADKPKFRDVCGDLIEFLGDAALVAHNASFDFGFLNAELARCRRPRVDLARMVDTLAIAKVRHAGAANSLDGLCRRYGVDRSHRVFHGALLDAQLLAQVYVELTGGRQIGLHLVAGAALAPAAPVQALPAAVRPARHFAPSEAERARHAAFLATIKDPIWTHGAAG